VLLLLDTFVDTPCEELAGMDMPVLVLTGVDDEYNASAEDLARALPHATHRVVPGNHMSAVTRPELGDAIAEWLAAFQPGS
jgi:pimeloyl-ACP methyl ester carboxylesterase